MAKEPACAGLYLEFEDGKNFVTNNSSLMSAVKAHRSEEFWEKLEPANKAALRRYAGYVRREARRRGLL